MTTPLGYDLSLTTDLDPGMIEVSGNVCVAQALARRLQTPRGGLIDDPNYGYDLAGHLNDDLAAADFPRIASAVDAEFLKDERVLSSTSTTTFTNGILVLTSTVVGSGGPFAFVLSVSAVTVQLLTVT